MKKIFTLMFISLAIIFCISYVKWTEFKKELIQVKEENARTEKLKKQNEERMAQLQEGYKKQYEEIERKNLDLRAKHKKARERSKYLTSINYAQYDYRKVNGTNTKDFSKLNFNLDNKEDIVSKGVSSFTTNDGITYSIANDDKVIAIKPQEYSLEELYKTGEIICRDNDNGACEEMGMISRSKLEDFVPLPEENIQELKERKKREQEEYVRNWEENWKKLEEKTVKRQISKLKGKQVTEKQKLEIAEKNKKRFERFKLLSLIADFQKRYHDSNGKYAYDFNELNFDLDIAGDVEPDGSSRFTTKDGIMYIVSSTRVTAIALKSNPCVLEQYYDGEMICRDSGAGICAEMGLKSRPMSENNRGRNKTSQQQTIGQRQREMTKEQAERGEKFLKLARRSKLLRLISEAQHNYYKYKSNGEYTDDLSELNLIWSEFGDIVSKDASSFTTTDGRIYSIKDKEKATLTKPQEYVLESYYKTREIICRDIRSGACEEMGMTPRS